MKTEKGFIKAFWCESSKCEAKIKSETKSTTRCLAFGEKEEKGKCIYCQKPVSTTNTKIRNFAFTEKISRMARFMGPVI